MAAETTFFQGEDIFVTNSRFVVGPQTFAMNGIISVEGVEAPPNRLASITLAGFGVTFVVIGIMESLGLALFGLIILTTGIWIWKVQKPSFSVVLKTADGEINAYQSGDGAFIGQVIRALNDAIVFRG